MVLLLGNNFFILFFEPVYEICMYRYHNKTDFLYGTVPRRFHTPVGTVQYKSVMLVPNTTTCSVIILQKNTRYMYCTVTHVYIESMNHIIFFELYLL